MKTRFQEVHSVGHCKPPAEPHASVSRSRATLVFHIEVHQPPASLATSLNSNEAHHGGTTGPAVANGKCWTCERRWHGDTNGRHACRPSARCWFQSESQSDRKSTDTEGASGKCARKERGSEVWNRDRMVPVCVHQTIQPSTPSPPQPFFQRSEPGSQPWRHRHRHPPVSAHSTPNLPSAGQSLYRAISA